MINSWYNPYPVSGITYIQIYTGTVSIQFCDTTIYHPPLDIVMVFTLYHQVLLIFYADVDECETNGTCPEHSTCLNTFGSFVCTCKEGFLKNGSVCIGKNSSGVIRICPIKATFLPSDVDECDNIESCPEHSTCANTFGSFVCTCNEGFMRNGSVCIGKNWITSLK